MCYRENCRHVVVGDMVIEHSRDDDDDKWVGIVVGAIGKKYMHDRVSIVWDRQNPNYNDKHGYSKTNLHNLRREYEIHKADA